jgi:hypothetical protein
MCTYLEKHWLPSLRLVVCFLLLPPPVLRTF